MMSEESYSNYPPDLAPEEQQYLLSTIKNWSIEHGLAVRPQPALVSKDRDPHGVLATNAPVTLFPSPFPRALFDEARSLQKTYNELYAAIATDEEWLGEIMDELIDVDPFVSSLWSVHLACKREGYVQPLSLGLFRSDYMLDAPTNSIKQVEFNTISSSFGGLSTMVSRLHTHLLTSPSPAYPAHPLLHPQALPENNTIEKLAAGLAAAHEAYGLSKSSTALPTCILIVTQDPNERNIFDQLHLTTALQSSPFCIPVFRLPVGEILSLTSISESNSSRPLIYTPPHSPHTRYEVTTLYLRALYSPNDHPNASSWTARHHLERSAAIKCPSILLQLAGCKKTQQVLATPLNPSSDTRSPEQRTTTEKESPNPQPAALAETQRDHLAHFLPDASEHTLTLLRSTFAPQYALSSPQGTKLALDVETAKNHVLKPQREGGGNNIYHENITKYLQSLPDDGGKHTEYKRWVLMELISPPSAAHNSVLKSDGTVVSDATTNELGIFGACLWRNPSVKPVFPDSQRPSLVGETITPVRREEEDDDLPVFDEYKPPEPEKDELPVSAKTVREVTKGQDVRPEILFNEEAGWLLRTKGRESDEGGVATGFACIDSVLLVD